MSKKAYEINFTAVLISSLEIVASSEEEALEMAKDKIFNEMFMSDIDALYVEDVYDVEEK